MRIRETRLPLSEVASLQEFSIQAAESFRPLSAPVYLLLEKNQKLVSIKAPFDFFTPQDFEKMGGNNKLYVSAFIHDVNPFIDAAFEVRQTLEWGETGVSGALGPASYELSDAVLRILARLWAEFPLSPSQVKVAEDPAEKNHPIGIESFFIAAFANHFCDPLPAEWIQAARDEDVENYEHALLKAGAVVFFALHLGYLDFAVLNQLYRNLFARSVKIEAHASLSFISKELNDLCLWVDSVIPALEIKVISSDWFSVGKSRAAQKLRSRLNRIRLELVNPDTAAPSVFGERGIYDV